MRLSVRVPGGCWPRGCRPTRTRTLPGSLGSGMRMAGAWWCATAIISRGILTSAGAIEVTAPRVNDKRTNPETGERKRFSSAIVPPWARKTPKITEVLPLLYLHGLSSGDFVPALGQFLGSSAGLSAAVVTPLTRQGKGEQRGLPGRGPSAAAYFYLWAAGVHVNVRLG